MAYKKIIKLVPPKLEHFNIKEKIVCIRGHKERFFEISTQKIENKYVFHNYGQGGAGWTFLFACVNESVRQFESVLGSSFKDEIKVIGAGCYGILTAIILAQKGFEVSVIAKETENIPSYKAAGFFFPRSRKCSTLQEHQNFVKFGMESYKTYLDIISGIHPFIKQGPVILPAYYAPDIDPGFKEYIECGLVKKPEDVVIDFQNGKIYNAVEYNTLFINPRVLMSELNKEFNRLNIKIEKMEIKSFSEVDSGVIFNCTGFGAKELTQDSRMVPVQGHLISLKDQDVNNLQYMINFKIPMKTVKGYVKDELVYFAPTQEGILGVTFLRGQDSLDANYHEFDRLIERSRLFFGTSNYEFKTE